MTTHTELCNIVLTRMMRYQKEAAHGADAVLTSALYCCIYSPAERPWISCICNCDHLRFAKWIQPFSRCCLCSLEQGLMRADGATTSLCTDSSSLGVSVRTEWSVGNEWKGRLWWLQPACLSSCLPNRHNLFTFQMSYRLDVTLLCTALCVCVCSWEWGEDSAGKHPVS